MCHSWKRLSSVTSLFTILSLKWHENALFLTFFSRKSAFSCQNLSHRLWLHRGERFPSSLALWSLTWRSGYLSDDFLLLDNCHSFSLLYISLFMLFTFLWGNIVALPTFLWGNIVAFPTFLWGNQLAVHTFLWGNTLQNY